MAWYPSLCSWMQEASRSAESPEQAYLDMQAMLEPVLIARLRRYGVLFYDTDVADCRDKVFDRMERKLSQPMEFRVRLAASPERESGREISLLGSTVKVGFLFDLGPEISRGGYTVRLRAADAGKKEGQVPPLWEENCAAEQCDTHNRTLPVEVPAKYLEHGRRYHLELDAAEGGNRIATQEFRVIHVEVLHLLRRGLLSIHGHHPELQPARTYRAQFHVFGGEESVQIAGLACTQERYVQVSLTYEQLEHEQDTRMNLFPEDGQGAYFSCVRAVRHESLGRRRGFLVQMARTVAYEHFRTCRKAPLCSIDDLPVAETPASADESQRRIAVLLAKSVVKKLPERTRRMLIAHEIEGRSWAEIAAAHQLSEAKAKQDISRALTQISKITLATESGSSSGAVQRFVNWVKESLSDIVPGGVRE